MILVDSCNINVFKKTLDQLNDLATSACQKVASMPIENLYTGYSIFRINPKNLLIQFKEFDEGANLIRSANYAYDALGRRIEKVVTDLQIPQNNKTRRYVYDGEDILLVLNENNEELSKYTHSTLRIDDALAIDDKENSKSYYFLKDHLGSIIDIVSEDNTFKQHYAYSSFGELQKVTDINGSDINLNPVLEHHFAYTGREYDSESGLYHYRARAYDASTGRFLQVDIDPGDKEIPLTFLSKYLYSMNNPQRYVDSDGQFPLLAIVVVAAVVGAASNFATAYNGGETNFWRLAGTSLLGAAHGAGVTLAGAYGGPLGAMVAGGVLGYLNGGLSGAITSGKWDSYGAEVGGINGFVSASVSIGLFPGGNLMTTSGANQTTFILSTMIGAGKTYADVTRNKREEDYNRCYTSGVCKGYAENIDPNTYRGTY